MIEDVDGYWYGLVRRTGKEPAEPPLEAEETWAEFERALEAADPRVSPCGERIEQEISGLYAELRRRAEQLMRHQPRGHTLQATALANEACLKLIGRADLAGLSRDDLFGLACRAMRSVLVDHARRRGRRKRSAKREHVDVDCLEARYEERSIDLVALDEALEELAGADPVMVKAVELHFFGGLSLPETARIVAISQRTLERKWALTKAWLRSRVEDDDPDGALSPADSRSPRL